MSDSDILERAKAIHEKYASRDESIDEVFQAHLAADLLPELIAEVERRRAALAHELDLRDRHIESLEARIKELEEMIRQLGSLAFMGDMPLDQIVAHFIAWGQSNYDYTSRLEAAFLESEAENQFHQDYGESDWEIHPDEEFDDHHGRNWYREEAREALERIRNGE